MELAKGVRDFSPEEMRLRMQVLDTIRHQFRLFGFEPLDTPILERLTTLNAKMEGSQATDVSKEIFQVVDQGGRDLGLRFDLTVPLARYVAMHKDLKLPFRRYEIGRVYRDGPIKLGRYREFVQCDADIVGATSALADAECINLAVSVFDALDIPVTVHVNSRSILDALCTKLHIKNPLDVMISLDKLEKIGRSGVHEELSKKGITAQQEDALFAVLLIQGTTAGKLAVLEHELGTAAVQPLRDVLAHVHATVEFTPSLARGLAYYTGTVFEAFAQDSPVKSSLMGGGRYDGLLSTLSKGAVSQPAVGVSFGIEPICDVLREAKNEPEESPTRVFVVPIGNTAAQAATILNELRELSVPSMMDLLGRAVTKNIEYASKLNIPFVLIVGEKELASGELTLKDLRTGEERKIRRDELEKVAVEL